jgi:hypothetical protein
VSKTPESLVPAIRQYKHNTGEDGFVFGYDKQETDSLVEQLESSNFEMREALFEINRMIRRGYVNLGDNLNYQIMAMFKK